MASDLLLPGGLAPSNLHLAEGTRASYVDGDLYRICDRMREVDQSLYAVQLSDDQRYAYAIMEDCEDGVQRLIFKVKELDGRVIEKLRYLMARPLHERLTEIEAMHHRLEADRKENELDELYEKLGRPMWTQLEHDGFIQRGVSYPKLGVTSRGRRAR